jgi:peptidoglycan/LPS O-acetylase OafA/YrhL
MQLTTPSGPDRRGRPIARESQIDGLRFLAFLAVFVYHYKENVCPWGWAGVPFFFALSGFLITRILVERESGHVGSDLKRFYIRRTLRIFPLYYAIIAFVATTHQVADVGGLLTYTYNIRAFLFRSLGGIMAHFWTLCVEEQFYLLYPLILLFTPARLRFAVVSALIVGAKLFQIHAHRSLPMPWARILLPYCGEDLLWGCLAGLIEFKTKPGRREGTTCFLAGLPILVLAWNLRQHRLPLPEVPQEIASLSLFGIGCALVVFGAWRSNSRWIVGPLAFAPVAYLGRISYGLYAFHYPVLRGEWLSAIPFGFLIPRPWGELALTIGLSAASWQFFEGPINRLKDRMGSKRLPPQDRSDRAELLGPADASRSK